ncbi:MAG: 3-dehydroquinate synthase [Acidobacteriota bacterium]|nr:3-dehydroquinate synthase [Acidobacteriota bacterium]
MSSPPVRLELRREAGSTSVWIGSGALDVALTGLSSLLGGRRVFVITSPPLRQLHGEALEPLAAAAGEFQVLEVADGEAAKTPETAIGVWRTLLAAGGKRDSLIVAFGGGSIGDLAGFVAGTFLRGVDYVQIPTTLLAQVDAAIGGKTAINLPEAKNSVGLFYHPLATIADTGFLGTLPPRQLRSGLFEVVKTAVMRDADLFSRLEADLARLLAGDADALAESVKLTAAAKIGVVEKDPKENDIRQLLNFGHTLGHALELSLEMLEHGEAVGYGMLFAIDLAVARGFAPGEADRVRALIRRIGLPPLPPTVPLEAVMARLERDKKAREAGLAWVVPLHIGSGEICTDIAAEDVRHRVGDFLGGRNGC